VTAPANTRRAASAPAPHGAELRPSRSARRAARRERCAALVAAGMHVPGRHRSLLDVGNAIARNAADEVAERRALVREQLAHARTDGDWHFDAETAREHKRRRRQREGERST
jgi:hypothetical protein